MVDSDATARLNQLSARPVWFQEDRRKPGHALSCCADHHFVSCHVALSSSYQSCGILLQHHSNYYIVTDIRMPLQSIIYEQLDDMLLLWGENRFTGSSAH